MSNVTEYWSQCKVIKDGILMFVEVSRFLRLIVVVTCCIYELQAADYTLSYRWTANVISSTGYYAYIL